MAVMAWPALVLLAALSGPSHAAEVLPAVQKVVTMLNNIVSMVETEQSTDEADYAKYSEWSTAEKAMTSETIASLKTQIENLNAALADLRAQRGSLTVTLTKVNSDLSAETAQLNTAREKRNEENQAFMSEQQDFENAVAACNKAAELLTAHYGDGSEKESSKPAWLSLLSEYMASANALARKTKTTKAVQKVAMLQQRGKNPSFDTYEDNTAGGLNIVEQVKELAGTFAENKQSAIEQENTLQTAFNTLSSKKMALINTLTAERDSQQAQLNQVNQDIAENEGALKMAQDTQQDRQSYLTNLGQAFGAAKVGYEKRSADRTDELAAVREGLAVLEKVSFMQKGSSITSMKAIKAIKAAKGTYTLSNLQLQLEKFGEGKAWASRIELRARQSTDLKLYRGAGTCENCQKAASLLRQQASTFHSSLLSEAAAATVGMDALDDVVSRLDELCDRIDEAQKTEQEHKDWCEDEMRRTSQKRDGHEYSVSEIQQTINDLTELVNMKKTAIGQKSGDIDQEDHSFEELSELREGDKEEYEENLQDHLDAIAALNEAIEILANFYAARKAKGQFIETGTTSSQGNLRGRQAPGGGQVVGIISGVRTEFEHARDNLNSIETAAESEFSEDRTVHIGTDNDLNHQKDVTTVEKQTAQQTMDVNEDDLESNKNEIVAATSYLQRLGRSCDPLIEHYDERKNMRREEKSAIKDAIKVIKEV